MPTLYRAECNNCGRCEDIGPSSYSEVFLDDGSLRRLPHPGAYRHITDYGFSWEEASEQGRLVNARCHACGFCGGVYICREPNASSQIGCTVTLWSGGVAAGLILLVPLFVRGVSWDEVAGSAWFSALIVAGMVTSYFEKRQRRHAERQYRIRAWQLADTRCCEKATRKTVIPLGSDSDKRLPCAACGHRGVRYIYWGIS